MRALSAALLFAALTLTPGFAATQTNQGSQPSTTTAKKNTQAKKRVRRHHKKSAASTSSTASQPAKK